MRRWSIAAAVLVAALGCLASLAPPTYAQRVMSGSTVDASPSPPSEFVVVHGLNSPNSLLDLVSTASGRVIRTLLTLSELSRPSLTNNGLQLSSNGRTVFSVWVDPKIAIEATATDGGVTRFVVDGLEPTLSPDGATLAYVTASDTGVGIMDLASGRARVWRLATLFKTARTHYIVPATNALAWFDHGSKLAVLVSPAPVAISAERLPKSPRAAIPPCATRATASITNCLAVLSTNGGSSRLEDIQALGSFGIYSGGSAVPSAVISVQLEQRASHLTWLTPDNQAVANNAVATIPGIVEDIDQTGRNVLYVDYSSELSYGVIQGDNFQVEHRYFGEVGAAAW